MTSAHKWTPLSREPVSNLISEQIVSFIKNGDFEPGDRLPSERELSKMLDVARPSVREALHSLQARGKVEIRHGSGAFVASPRTEKDIIASVYAEEVSLEELYEMRGILELPAARIASQRASAEQIATIRDNLERLTEASKVDEPDWSLLRELDARFHLSIVQAAGNRFLTSVQGVLQSIISKGMASSLKQPGRLQESSVEHLEIFRAISSRDEEAALEALSKHINNAMTAAKKQNSL